MKDIIKFCRGVFLSKVQSAHGKSEWSQAPFIGLLVAYFLTTPCLAAEEERPGPGTQAHEQSLPVWLWREQIKPMFEGAAQPSELTFLASSAVGVAIAHQYDPQVEDNFDDHQRFTVTVDNYGSFLGSGAPGVTIAVIQLIYDRSNGLSHARALAFTSVSAISIAELVQRERPNHSNNLAFPSGHTSSAFATATSLAYAYGPWVGVPALALAGFVGATRIAGNDHWLSDTIGGAALGIFWARASAKVAGRKFATDLRVYPEITSREAQLRFGFDF